MVPISSNVTDIIKKYKRVFKLEKESDWYMFVNRNNEPLSRSGVAYILKKYVKWHREKNLNTILVKKFTHMC